MVSHHLGELMPTPHSCGLPNPPSLSCPGEKGNTISKSVLLPDCLREAARQVEPRRTETQAPPQPTPLPTELRISVRGAHRRAGGTEAGAPPEPAFSRTRGPGHRPSNHEGIRPAPVSQASPARSLRLRTREDSVNLWAPRRRSGSHPPWDITRPRLRHPQMMAM